MEFVDLEIEETQKVKSSDEHQKSANQIESDLMDISINTERTSSIPKHSVALEPKLSEKIDLKIQMAKSFFNWSSTSPSDNKLQEKQSTMNSIVKSGLLEVELEQKLESALSRLDSISEIIEEFIKVIDGFVVAHEYMGKSEKQFSRFLTHKGVHESIYNIHFVVLTNC